MPYMVTASVLGIRDIGLGKEYIEKEWETGANVGFSKIEWSIAAQQVWFSVD